MYDENIIIFYQSYVNVYTFGWQTENCNCFLVDINLFIRLHITMSDNLETLTIKFQNF